MWRVGDLVAAPTPPRGSSQAIATAAPQMGSGWGISLPTDHGTAEPRDPHSAPKLILPIIISQQHHPAMPSPLLLTRTFQYLTQATSSCFATSAGKGLFTHIAPKYRILLFKNTQRLLDAGRGNQPMESKNLSMRGVPEQQEPRKHALELSRDLSQP